MKAGRTITIQTPHSAILPSQWFKLFHGVLSYVLDFTINSENNYPKYTWNILRNDWCDYIEILLNATGNMEKASVEELILDLQKNDFSWQWPPGLSFIHIFLSLVV